LGITDQQKFVEAMLRRGLIGRAKIRVQKVIHTSLTTVTAFGLNFRSGSPARLNLRSEVWASTRARRLGRV